MTRRPDVAVPPSRVGTFLALPVVGYQRYIRPMRASAAATCRYEPSCSVYAVEALTVWGPVRGSLLAVRRLARCQPWGGLGLDPVPPRTPRDVHPKRDGDRHGRHLPRSSARISG